MLSDQTNPDVHVLDGWWGRQHQVNLWLNGLSEDALRFRKKRPSVREMSRHAHWAGVFCKATVLHGRSSPQHIADSQQGVARA